MPFNYQVNVGAIERGSLTLLECKAGMYVVDDPDMPNLNGRLFIVSEGYGGELVWTDLTNCNTWVHEGANCTVRVRPLQERVIIAPKR